MEVKAVYVVHAGTDHQDPLGFRFFSCLRDLDIPFLLGTPAYLKGDDPDFLLLGQGFVQFKDAMYGPGLVREVVRDALFAKVAR